MGAELTSDVTGGDPLLVSESSPTGQSFFPHPLGTTPPPPPDEPMFRVPERLERDGFLLCAEGDMIPESRARELGLL